MSPFFWHFFLKASANQIRFHFVVVEFKFVWLSHKVLDNVHRLFFTLSFFWLDKFVQIFSLISILVLLLFLLESIDIVYTGNLARLEERNGNCFLSEIMFL